MSEAEMVPLLGVILHDDFAITQFTRRLGDAGTYQKLLKPSENWTNPFDPETRWIRPRISDCAWLQGFDAGSEEAQEHANSCSLALYA